MDASLLVTIGIAVVGWVVGLIGVWTKTTEKINDLATALWKAINDNTGMVKDLVNKVDRDLGVYRGDFMQQLERTSGRITTLETIFKMGQARREAYDAADYLHKPEAAAAVVDALLDELKDELSKVAPMTPERKAELEHRLIAHLESVQPDTGERRLLKATYALLGSEKAMPVEPSNKAPDVPKQKHDDDDDSKKKAPHPKETP